MCVVLTFTSEVHKKYLNIFVSEKKDDGYSLVIVSRFIVEVFTLHLCEKTALTLMIDNLSTQNENTAWNNLFFIANYHNSSNVMLQELRTRYNLFRGPHTKAPAQVPNDMRIIFTYQRHRNGRARRNYNGSGHYI